MAEKVMEKIGRQYVKLMAAKISEIEKHQAEIKGKIAELFDERLKALMAQDLEKARAYTHEVAYLIDRCMNVDAAFNDLKRHLEDVLTRFGEEDE